MAVNFFFTDFDLELIGDFIHHKVQFELVGGLLFGTGTELVHLLIDLFLGHALHQHI